MLAECTPLRLSRACLLRSQRLNYTIMQPKHKDAVQGLLVFHHGLTEHSGRLVSVHCMYVHVYGGAF